MEAPDSQPKSPESFDSNEPELGSAAPVAPAAVPDASAPGRRASLLQVLYQKFRPLAAAGAILAAELPNQAQAKEPVDGRPRQEQMTMAERHAQLAGWAAPLGVDGLSFARGPWRSMSENVTVLVGGKDIGAVKAQGLELTEAEFLAGLSGVLRKAGIAHREDAAASARAEMEANRAASAAAAAAEAAAAEAKSAADRAAAIADARARGEKKPVEQMTMAERHAQLAGWAAPLGVDGLSFARGPWRSMSENVTVLVGGKDIGGIITSGIDFERGEFLDKLSKLLDKEGVKHERPALREADAPKGN